MPPFVAAASRTSPETGRGFGGIDAALEYVRLEQEMRTATASAAASHAAGPIGLGYRVPLVIASPWSRGGCVCSQVFDHTSIVQFLEKF